MEESKFYYAQLNEENICVVVGEYPVEMDEENMIPLEKLDTNVLGCKYDDGTWSAIEWEEPVDEADIIQAELLLNQMTIMEKQEEQDEVLAEILLNQMEG